jgi:hypothetical protein
MRKIKVLRGFAKFYKNSHLFPKMQVAMRASNAALQNIPSKFPTQTALTKASEFFLTQLSNYKFQPK